jgi:hypothetical protein
MDRQRERHDAASVLLAFVESESRMNISLIKTFRVIFKGINPLFL